MRRTLRFLATILLFSHLCVHSSPIRTWMGEGTGDWQEPSNWFQQLLPDRSSLVHINIVAAGDHTITMPTNRLIQFDSLVASAQNAPNQMLNLITDHTHIQAKDLIIGSAGNQGVSHLHLNNHSKLHSLDKQLVIAKFGVGIVRVTEQSYMSNSITHIGEYPGSIGILLSKDLGSHLQGTQLFLGRSGKGALILQDKSQATFGTIHLASPRTNTTHPSVQIPTTEMSEGVIKIEGNQSHLKTQDILLAKQGVAKIIIQNGGQFTTQTLMDPETELQQNFVARKKVYTCLEILNQGSGIISEQLDIGNSNTYHINVLKNSVLQANIMHLRGSKAQEPINTLMAKEGSTVIVNNILQIGTGLGNLLVKIDQYSQLVAKESIVGTYGTGTAYLQIFNHSNFFGETAHIGFFQQGELVIANNSHLYLNENLFIGQKNGNFGRMILSTDSTPNDALHFGSSIQAKNIFLADKNSAEIVIRNHTQDLSPTLITSDILGEGTIIKEGTGLLRMFGQQSWKGRFSLLGGVVEIPAHSTLSSETKMYINQSGILRLNQSQVLDSLENYGGVLLAQQHTTSVLRIKNALKGLGFYWIRADFNALQADSIAVEGKVSGRQGLVVDLELNSPIAQTQRIPVAKAQEVRSPTPFYLLPKVKDHLGAYFDHGLERYSLDLVQENDRENHSVWYLELRKRDPIIAGNPSGLPSNLSQTGQEIVHQLKWFRTHDNNSTQPPFAGDFSLATQATVLPYTGSESPLNFLREHPNRSIGFAVHLPSHKDQYTLESWQKNQFSVNKVQTFNTKTQGIRAKWQQKNGWQTFIGYEQTGYLPIGAQTSHFNTRNHNGGVAYFWHLPSRWFWGPELQFTRWHDKPQAFTMASGQTARYALTREHSSKRQLGFQLGYLPHPETSLTMSLAGYFSQHRERIQLESGNQKMTIPFNYSTQHWLTQIQWKTSEWTRWKFATEYRSIEREEKSFGVLFQWQMGF